MQHTANEIIETLKTLPSSEKVKILEWLTEEEKEKREKDENLQRDIERYKKSEKWLKENREKYMNQWVCLEGDQLIAHGTDGMEVHRKAKEAGIEAPFLEHIVDESKPFGGW